MRIELITHCYAVQYKHYAQLLCYQLSSLALFPPKCEVGICVCCSPTDKATIKMVDWFLENVKYPMRRLFQEPPILARRGIGRGKAANTTKADIVWFADCDQFYDNGCLDKLSNLEWPDGASMVFPNKAMIHKSRAMGLRASNDITSPRLADINRLEFTEHVYFRAIGGVQIVEGDFARKYGYLNKSKKYQEPRESGNWEKCIEDRYYRRFCSKYGSMESVDLLGMYRIQHRRR